MSSLNHLSSLTSTLLLLMPSSSALPALSPYPLGKTLHPGHHGDDSDAVALAALSANWGNYNLAAAGVPSSSFRVPPLPLFLSIPFPLYFSIPPSSFLFTLPPTLPWIFCPLLLTRPLPSIKSFLFHLFLNYFHILYSPTVHFLCFSVFKTTLLTHHLTFNCSRPQLICSKML